MVTFEQLSAEITHLVESGNLAQAEQQLDLLADMDSDDLDRLWGFQSGQSAHYLSIFYNNVGLNYKSNGMEAVQRGDRNAVTEAALGAERCHQKAWDMYDMAVEDVIFLPHIHPLNKNIIFTLWGLGSVKYVLGKHQESRKFLMLCIRLHPEDEQATAWQSDAHRFLRLLDGGQG